MKTLSLAALAATLVAAHAHAQQLCTNDIDCDCGQVCSYIVLVNGATSCVPADGGDPGWCSPGAGLPNNGCIYACQTCQSAYCEPAWHAGDVCVKGSGTSGGSCPGGTSGSSSTSGGVKGTSSGGGGSTTGGAQGTSSGGGGGTSGGAKGTSSGGAGGTTGSTSTSGSGGGCGHAPGDFCWVASGLAVGLFARSRRRRG